MPTEEILELLKQALEDMIETLQEASKGLEEAL